VECDDGHDAYSQLRMVAWRLHRPFPFGIGSSFFHLRLEATPPGLAPMSALRGWALWARQHELRLSSRASWQVTERGRSMTKSKLWREELRAVPNLFPPSSHARSRRLGCPSPSRPGLALLLLLSLSSLHQPFRRARSEAPSQGACIRLMDQVFLRHGCTSAAYFPFRPALSASSPLYRGPLTLDSLP
jgi:hypothetical protein